MDQNSPEATGAARCEPVRTPPAGGEGGLASTEQGIRRRSFRLGTGRSQVQSGLPNSRKPRCHRSFRRSRLGPTPQPWNKIEPSQVIALTVWTIAGDAACGRERSCGDPTGHPEPHQDACGATSLVEREEAEIDPGISRCGWIIAAHTSSIAIETMAVESPEEKPDWDSWPSIVKWAAQLDPKSPAARSIARGAPVGPPLGVEVAPEDLRHGPLTPPPEDEPLTVVSGYLDDRRQLVEPGHEMYAAATFAYAYRDFWTDREHRDYWRTHLHLWPSPPGRRLNRESLAFAVVNVESIGVPLEVFLEEFGYSRDDLRDRHVLDLAERMRGELDAGPSDVRLPRVVTDEERDRMPLLTGYQTLDAVEGAANVNVSPLARDVVVRGSADAVAARRGRS